MVVNFDGTVINLRDKLAGADRKKTQSETALRTEQDKPVSGDKEKAYVADVIGIRNENRLAVTAHSALQSEEEAYDMLNELKSMFQKDSENALNAHKKASPDAVMQFYPFE
jgi:hypothetical protein